MLHRRVLTFLLIFCVLFAQQAALVHAASHWQEESRSSRQELQYPEHAGEHVCAACVAFAALASALPSGAQRFDAALSQFFSLPARNTPAHPVGWPAYSSRAPPAFLA